MKIVLATLLALALLAAAHRAEATGAVIIRSADFDHSGCVSLEEVYEEASYFGTYKGGPQNSAGRIYDVGHDLRREVDPGMSLAEKFHIDVGDILQAVAQYRASPCDKAGGGGVD
jgi:hypothetical protein